ncbi:MAG: hypothetical protein FK733_04995 [Asgard group archaeon]|nr:hypothetical protein [Asgard group archaeon]
MKTQQLGHNDQIVQDVWGDICLECDCAEKPAIHSYNLKTEQVIVLSCPVCDFTIVVVEVDKISSSNVHEELPEKDKTLLTAHQQY